MGVQWLGRQHLLNAHEVQPDARLRGWDAGFGYHQSRVNRVAGTTDPDLRGCPGVADRLDLAEVRDGCRVLAAAVAHFL
jgi:hypothetical protein